MNQHFLTVCLFFLAGCALGGMLAAAVLAARARSAAGVVLAVVVALAVAAVLANGAVDLW